MIIIGLTGGIGSGKTTVAAMLAKRGARVIDADHVGHEVYQPGTSGYEQVVAAFGPKVVAPDGTIDRVALGRCVFADAKARERLNRIVHPLIGKEIMTRVAAVQRTNEAAAVVIEAALLDARWRKLVTVIWVVIADRNAVLDRLQQGRGLARAEIEARMGAQLSDEERRGFADVVLDNSGSIDDLRRVVDSRWDELIGA